ncbi:MAG: flavodoxin family protein [Deltaproteobacteria bacterium]|nr:flavodoxin family protein [Deltaproteobacteria bacterium]
MNETANSSARPEAVRARIAPEARILAVSGSPRKGGNSDKIALQALAAAGEAGVPGSLVRLVDYRFGPCIGCERCRRDKACTAQLDGMQLLYPQVERSLGLLLVSPVHNYNVTAWMKAFIDRLYCYYDFGSTRPGEWSTRLADQGRKAAVVSVGEQHGSEGIGLTLEAMRLPLQALGYELVAETPVTGVFERGRVAGDAGAMDRIGDLGRRLAGAVK